MVKTPPLPSKSLVFFSQYEEKLNPDFLDLFFKFLKKLQDAPLEGRHKGCQKTDKQYLEPPGYWAKSCSKITKISPC